MKHFALLALLLAIGGCQKPCEARSILSAYEAEAKACNRHFEYREDALECLAEVEAMYAPRFIELGVDTAESLKDLRKELEK